MGLPAVKLDNQRYTIDEYLALVDTVEGKYEYHNGRLVDWRAMAGAAEPHALIAANVIGELRVPLKGNPCRVYSSDLILRIPQKAKYLFGDAVVICGPTEFDPADKSRAKAVMNPKIIVEVISPTSEGDDRGEKFGDYREIDSLEEYVLVAQDKPSIEVFRRQSKTSWVLEVFDGLDNAVMLRSIQQSLRLAEVYAGVTFPPEQDSEEPVSAPPSVQE